MGNILLVAIFLLTFTAHAVIIAVKNNSKKRGKKFYL